MLVGIISDTHGVLPGAAFDALSGVDHIIHAGDVGAELVLTEMGAIAPVTAVAGNMDQGDLARMLPSVASVLLDGLRFVVAHKLPDLLRAEAARAADVLVSGHTHVLSISNSGPVLLLNPGSVTQPREGAGGTLLVLDTAARPLEPTVVSL